MALPTSETKLETILLVVPDPALNAVLQDILLEAHFDVLVASSAPESLEIENQFTRKIDLLLVDIKLQGVTGPDLAAAFQKLRPDLYVMLVSGFPGGDLLVLNYGWYFLQQQSVPKILVERINEVLHTPRRDQGTDRFLTQPSILGLPLAE